jgi:fused signal recognition particle receptor
VSEETKKGWFQRMSEGLKRSSSRISENMAVLFTQRLLDEKALEELEEVLIAADLGPATAAKLTADFAHTSFGMQVSDEEIRATLAQSLSRLLAPVAIPFTPDFSGKPYVALVIGVNGAGKTTTIGKLGKLFKGDGRRVMVAAGDTFRAAAVEQMQIWGDRVGVPVYAKEAGADAAALSYEALEQARADNIDLLLIDTAGRLHNKSNLMEELGKIARVLKKLDTDAPHAVLLVLDASTGQNALQQVEAFAQMIPITGLIVTKLDSSAKGGILVALAEKFKLPVHAIGVGESADDLQPFDALQFSQALMGVTSL